MLILLVRILFVLFAAIIGFNNGQLIYRGLFDLPPWFGGALGFGVAVTLIAAEQAFRRRFTRSLVAFLIGGAGGLLLSSLLVSAMRQILPEQSDFNNTLAIATTIVITYLVLITVMRNVDRWRVILPFVELKADQYDGGLLVVDGNMLGDTRLPSLLKTGFFAQRLLVHRDVLTFWESEASVADPARQRKATRALEGLAELRAMGMPPVEVDETEIPNSTGLGDTLIRLCRLEGSRLLTSDRDLTRRCEAEGVQVVDLNALANVLAPQLKPGQDLQVLVSKPGEGKGQGVGFLDDGSMVVINGAADQLGEVVTCTIARMHTTSNGRMVFADRA
jgi:uncharacterized protein YacL